MTDDISGYIEAFNAFLAQMAAARLDPSPRVKRCTKSKPARWRGGTN